MVQYGHVRLYRVRILGLVIVENLESGWTAEIPIAAVSRILFVLGALAYAVAVMRLRPVGMMIENRGSQLSLQSYGMSSRVL